MKTCIVHNTNNTEEEASCGMFTELCQTPYIPMVGNYLSGTGLHLIKQVTVLSQTSLPSTASASLTAHVTMCCWCNMI